MDRISRLLEIIERERNHELLMFVKNLQELGASPFLYIVLVLPCPMLAELVKGENFVLPNLLKLIPGSSSQVEYAPKPLVRPDYLPLFAQDPKPAKLPLAGQDSRPTPQAAKKKKRKTRQDKVASTGLEGFVDWKNPTFSKSVEEKEVEAGFAARMLKRAASA